MELKWAQPHSGAKWHDFEDLQLWTARGHGVYLIWCESSPARVLVVGQGNFANKLASERSNPEVMRYRKNGVLRVTWAEVPMHQMDGIQRHLMERWSPVVRNLTPGGMPIAVNSPW